MIAYFDTSALVKLVVAEDGSAVASTLWSRASRLATSRIAYPEARAALAAARRSGRLDERSLTAAKRTLRARLAEAFLVDATEDVCLRAGDLAERHELRGYDAVHLAALLSMAAESPVLVTWDRELGRAAAGEGIAVAT